MGSLRVGHDWAASLSLFTFMHWRRKWQPTPLFSPGESQGQGSLVGCHLRGRTESDMTEVTQQQQQVLWLILWIYHYYKFSQQCYEEGVIIPNDMKRDQMAQHYKTWTHRSQLTEDGKRDAFSEMGMLLLKVLWMVGADWGILNIKLLVWDLSPQENKQLSSVLPQNWVWKYI